MNCISYELARNGDFFDYIKVSGSLPKPIVQVYVQQLIKAMSSMHQAGVCHRDLKLENLVLDDNFNLKLIDFGFACSLSGSSGSGFCEGSEKVGTQGYMAPEIMMECSYQPTVTDTFALGVIIFIMYTGVPPFGKAHMSDKYYNLICLKKHDLFWRAHEQHHGAPFSQEFKDLMSKMLDYQPYQRMNLVEVLMHPFLQQGEPQD